MIRYPLEPEEDIEVLFGGTRMTLCLAGACIEKKKPRIVTCIDWKTTTALGSSQTFDKLQKIGKGWVALLAGKASRARELSISISRVLNSQEITAENVRDLVTLGAAAHGKNLKGEYCLMKFGMTYDQFRQWAKDNQSLAKPYLSEITKLKFGASVLVAGFVKDEQGEPYPAICRVSQQTSEVSLETHFGAIGEGVSVAVPPLLRREYDWEEVSLAKAIYYLYEAKTLAEIIDSVGPSTSIDVMYPDGTMKSLESEGYRYYGELLKEFGPKPKSKIVGIELKDAYLGPFEDKPVAKQSDGIKLLSQPSGSQKSKSKR